MVKQYFQEDIYSSTLYVVPTPIGNLEDITRRALFILRSVNIIASESIQHTKFLLKHFNINTLQLSLHKHNEQKITEVIVEKIQRGQSIALVSNAGTPVINDPGYYLIRRCREQSIRIVPLPGACAAITALSASGLPSNRFCYEGFLPKKREARLHFMRVLAKEQRTLIFYESTHRLLESIEDMITVWGEDRYIVLARELTKKWENIYGSSIGELLIWIKKDQTRQRGEIVFIVKGYCEIPDMLSPDILYTLSLLLVEFPLKKAAMLTAKIHNVKKNILYRFVIDQQKKYFPYNNK